MAAEHPELRQPRIQRLVRRVAGFAALLAAVAAPATAQMPGMPGMGTKDMRWSNTLFVLFDQLEYSPAGDARPVSVDALAWYGNATDRLWVRAQGEQLTTRREGEAEAQLLYGRLVDPFWDAVIGVRVDQRWGEGDPAARTRAQLVVGFYGLAPYRFELEPTLYVSPKGDLSARLEAGYQFMLTQRLVAEPEVELNLALQPVRRYGITRGLNDYETGVRVRYEFRREVAPYAGISRSRRIGEGVGPSGARTGTPAETRFVVGMRLWR